MVDIPEPLRTNRELQARHLPEGGIELRCPWMPINPPVVFGVLMALAAAGLVLMLGWPSSRDLLQVEGTILGLLVYPISALCFNATTVTVTPHEVRWRFGPLPWKPGGRISAGEVESLKYGRIRRTVGMEEAQRERQSGYRASPTYALDLCRTPRKREVRLFDSVKSEATLAVAARLIASELGGVSVERAERRSLADRSNLGLWIGGTIVLVVVGGLIWSLMFSPP